MLLQDNFHKKIVYLASNCESSRWVYNALSVNFKIDAAIIENPISKIKLTKGRIKRIGLIKVTGQVLFSAFMAPFLRWKSKKRKTELVNLYHLNNNPFKTDHTIFVNAVNDNKCKQLIEEIQPDIIIVNGTRIISKKILQSTDAIFINMHVGITPWYRGSHGGYWAIANKDAENFGTTIHLIDAGVDTGPVLKQVFIQPSKKDNFSTYPVLQVAIGISALKEVLSGLISGTLHSQVSVETGKMYYQPTLWEYLMKSKKPTTL